MEPDFVGRVRSRGQRPAAPAPPGHISSPSGHGDCGLSPQEEGAPTAVSGACCHRGLRVGVGERSRPQMRAGHFPSPAAWEVACPHLSAFVSGSEEWQRWSQGQLCLACLSCRVCPRAVCLLRGPLTPAPLSLGLPLHRRLRFGLSGPGHRIPGDAGGPVRVARRWFPKCGSSDGMA